MHHGIPTLAVLAIALLGCQHGKSSEGMPAPGPSPQLAPTEAKAKGSMPVAFWKDFQNALRARDAQKVADMTSFPADIGIAGIDGFKGINHREGFIRHFDTIFPKEAAETLLATKASDLKFESSSNAGKTGDYWFVSHDHQDPIASEYEWTIGYVFTRQNDGRVLLTQVDFAG
jgi:hypothetical protein